MPSSRTTRSASPSPSSGIGRSTTSKHDSVTMPTGRFFSTTCRFTAKDVTLRTMIPVEVTDCTPAFFSDAFEATVDHVELLDRSSGTTGRARFALRGERSVPETVFVKLAPFDEQQRAFVQQVGMGVAEARFYRDLAFELPVRVPQAYYAETDDEAYVMVLEDLEASKCWFPNPDDPDIAARALDIVEQLAALHVPYQNSSRFDDDGDLAWLSRRGTGGGDGG